MDKKLKDTLIAALLLPALIAAAYIFLWSRPLTRSIASARNELRGIGKVEDLLMQRTGLQAEQASLRRQAAELEAMPEAAPLPPQPEPGSALKRLQGVFQDKGIRLVSASAVAPDSGRASSHNDPVRKSFNDIGCTGFERWNVTLQAPYPAMVGLLEACASNSPPIVAEALTLSIAGGEKQAPYWTMQLCL